MHTFGYIYINESTVTRKEKGKRLNKKRISVSHTRRARPFVITVGKWEKTNTFDIYGTICDSLFHIEPYLHMCLTSNMSRQYKWMQTFFGLLLCLSRVYDYFMAEATRCHPVFSWYNLCQKSWLPAINEGELFLKNSLIVNKCIMHACNWWIHVEAKRNAACRQMVCIYVEELQEWQYHFWVFVNTWEAGILLEPFVTTVASGHLPISSC